jgi:hypothetical protein
MKEIKMEFTKIDLIQITRIFIPAMSLTDAKLAAEEFLDASECGAIDTSNKDLVKAFLRYLSAFVREEVEVRSDGIYPTAPGALTNSQIREISSLRL